MFRKKNLVYYSSLKINNLKQGWETLMDFRLTSEFVKVINLYIQENELEK